MPNISSGNPSSTRNPVANRPQKFSSVDAALKQVKLTSTPPENKMAAIKQLSKLSYSDYKVKVAAQVAVITQGATQENPEKFYAEAKKYYEDNPYLGSQVSDSLKHTAPDVHKALFGDTPVGFESSLYKELQAHQENPDNIHINQLLDQRSDVTAFIKEAEAKTPNPVTRSVSNPTHEPVSPTITPLATPPRPTTTPDAVPAPTASVKPQPKSPVSALSANDAAKELYLAGIRTTEMLGNHEMQPLANLIRRPVVVVRAEESAGTQGHGHTNNVELIVYPTGVPENLDNAVYVHNIHNGHFRTFTPTHGADVLAGTHLPGTSKEGDYTGAGTNDCLIASIRGNGVSFDMSNLEVRGRCADYQLRNGHDNAYVADRAYDGSFIDFPEEAAIPDGFTGHVIIKPSQDYYAQGEYTGGRIGKWSFLTPNGKFDVTYDHDSHQPVEIIQTGEYKDDGTIDLLTDPTEFRDIATALPFIEF